METYSGLESASLEELRIYPMKTLLLEMKDAAEQFEEYDPTRMVVKINVWREGIQALTEECLRPVQVKVQRDMQMSDLSKLITEQFGIENPIVMKRNPMLNQKQLEVLQQDKSLTQLRVNEGVNLFVDQGDKWEREFDLDQNRLLIKYNQPQEHQPHTADVVYKDFVIVDRRESILDLKLKIAQSLVRPL